MASSQPSVRRLDWSAVWRPALSVCVFLLPVGILQTVLVHDKSIAKGGGVNLLLFGVILFLTAVAGFGAGRLTSYDLAKHGAAAGALAYAIVQGVGIIHHVIIGESLDPVGYVYLGLLSATCGMLGAMLERRQRRLEQLRHEAGR